MRRQGSSRLHPLLIIVPLTLLVFSARLIWAQETPATSKTPIQSASLVAPFAAVPEAGIRFNPAYGKLSLPDAPHQGSSLLRFRPFDVGYLIPLSKNGTSKDPRQLAKIDEQQAKANQFIGNAPAVWFTPVIPQNAVSFRTPDLGGALQYYGHRIPWAGRVMLRVGKQAEFHPRVVRAFELIRPGLNLEKRKNPRWLGR